MGSRKLTRITKAILGAPKRAALSMARGVEKRIVNVAAANTRPEYASAMKQCMAEGTTCKCREARHAYNQTRLACVPYRFDSIRQEWAVVKQKLKKPLALEMGEIQTGLWVLIQIAVFFFIGLCIGRMKLYGYEDEPWTYMEPAVKTTQEPKKKH